MSLQILKNPTKILVLLPLEPHELSSFIPALKLLRESFRTSQITGVVKEEDALFFKRTGTFNQIITYQSMPFFLSRQFFRLKKKLRTECAEMSIDFNQNNDLLTWIAGANLRIGTQTSSFINYKVKLNEKDIAQNALKLVKTICIGR